MTEFNEVYEIGCADILMPAAQAEKNASNARDTECRG